MAVLPSEAEIVSEIEAVRGQLNKEIGDKYSFDKIQAANAISAHLDQLINEWFAIQAKKKAGR